MDVSVDPVMLHALEQRHSEPEFAALPPEAPLAMPEQSLWDARERSAHPGTAARTMPLRRLVVLGGAIVMTMAAAYEMYQVLAVGGLTILEMMVLGLFVLLFAWIALSFVSTMVGFLGVLVGRDKALGIDPLAPLPELSARTALLLPTYNEDPHRVMARLQTIYEEVEKTGRIAHFDFYILSDTTDAAIWVAEEAAFLRLRERTGSARIYYRHRSRNIGRKAGNVGEWVTRFGGHYVHMVVLDADSLMEGDTIVRLAAAMEQHPRVGLIQTLPVLLNGNTLFARIQQFAGRVYGPLIARGFAWWYGGDSNYWGHNAIIRVQAFAEQAGLPQLPGPKPFGGHILSHDFIEAALLRRAGWAIHMVPSLGGSYEECPPSMSDYAVRDRRWCQGNLQHVSVLPARGLHWMSRLHLATGIGTYVTAPLWLVFLLVGIMISLQAQFIRPEYFPSGATLFPRWPAQDPVRAAYVFAITMALLVLPKFLGFLAALLRRRTRYGMGGAVRGFVSVLFEIVVSALIAPIMMLMQCRAVVEILLGRDAGWSAQRRDDGSLPHGELMRQYMMPTVLGLMLGAGAYAVSTPLLLWMLPVVIGLVLAIPVAALTGQPNIGRRLRKLGLLLTPEEREAPPVLVRANVLAAEYAEDAAADPITLLTREPILFDTHMRMLGDPAPRRKGDVDVELVVALAKIDDAEDCREAAALLQGRELFAVLANRNALQRMFAKPPVRLHEAQMRPLHPAPQAVGA
jgi:membrane glycosyltransferase